MKGIKIIVLAAFMSSSALACLYCPPPAPASGTQSLSPLCPFPDDGASTDGMPAGLGSGGGDVKPPAGGTKGS